MISSICVKTVQRIFGTVQTVHTLNGGTDASGTKLMAYGQGDSIVISTSASVRASGDNLVLEG